MKPVIPHYARINSGNLESFLIFRARLKSGAKRFLGHYLLLPIFLAFLLPACNTPAKQLVDARSKQQVLAFPEAEGYGRFTTGGRGGKVLSVTNLNDSGPGSLRQAVETNGARYVLFSISGTIALKTPLRIENGDLTIAGQTAPGDGICIRNYPVFIDADNVIIRYLRFRLGDEEQVQDDALGSRRHQNLIIDHCSMSWSVDECVSFYSNENTSLQWCIISESLSHSYHEKGHHGFGGIWGGKKASFHHNLLAHHSSRNPRLGEFAGDPYALTDLVDLRNNVIYNWGYNSCYAGEGMNVNMINCYYKPGPASKDRNRIVEIWNNQDSTSAIYGRWGKFYIAGNFVEGSAEATENNWKHGVNFRTPNPLTTEELANIQLSEPHGDLANVNTHTAQEAYKLVLDHAGASLVRDAVDQRIIDNVRQGTYTAQGSKGGRNGIIDSPDDVGGFPVLQSQPAPTDSSGDGIPDNWKRSIGLLPAVYQANGRDLHPDYDNIEVYFNSLVSPGD